MKKEITFIYCSDKLIEMNFKYDEIIAGNYKVSNDELQEIIDYFISEEKYEYCDVLNKLKK